MSVYDGIRDAWEATWAGYAMKQGAGLVTAHNIAEWIMEHYGDEMPSAEGATAILEHIDKLVIEAVTS